MVICMVLLVLLELPWYPRARVFKLNLPALTRSTKEVKWFNMRELVHQWKKEGRAFKYFDLRTVIQVHFNPECTYGQFIQLGNIMKVQMQPIYACDDNDFYIWLVDQR